MMFTLNLDELSILYAIVALILLVTSEILSPYNHRLNININIKRLRKVAIIFSILFIVTAGLRIFTMFSSL